MFGKVELNGYPQMRSRMIIRAGRTRCMLHGLPTVAVRKQRRELEATQSHTFPPDGRDSDLRTTIRIAEQLDNASYLSLIQVLLANADGMYCGSSGRVCRTLCVHAHRKLVRHPEPAACYKK
jgi:hypothetical protein